MKSAFIQFLCFTLVGGMGTLAHYAVLFILVEAFVCDPVLSSALGAIVGAVVNYVLNYRYTFKSSGSHKQLGPKYFVIAFTCFGLNTVLMHVFVNIMSLDYRLSQISVSAVLLVWNFIAARLWVFTKKREKLRPSGRR